LLYYHFHGIIKTNKIVTHKKINQKIMKEKDKREQDERELQVIRMKFFRDLQNLKMKWGHLDSFQNVRKILHSPDQTRLISLGLNKDKKESMFLFLKNKMAFDIPKECQETMETVYDFIACVYIVRDKKTVKNSLLI